MISVFGKDHPVFQLVLFVRFRACSDTLSSKIKGDSCLAHPPDLQGRVANDQRIRRYILYDHGAGTDHGVRTNLHTTKYSSVGSNGCAFMDNCFFELSPPVDEAAGI